MNYSNAMPSNLTTNHKPVTLKELETHGVNFNGITFNVGDVIDFPKEDEMQFWMFEFRPGQTAPTLMASLNEKILALSVGSFNRVPCDDYLQPFLAKYPVNKEIYDAENHSARAKLLAGKKLKIKEIVEDRKPIFIYSAISGKQVRDRDEEGAFKTQPGKFYVFEWA